MKKHVIVALIASLLLINTSWANGGNKTLTFVNNSGCTDTQIYILVWGYNVPSDGYPRHLNLLTSEFVLCSTNDNTVSVPDQEDLYCDYYVTLNQIRQTNGAYSFTFPQIDSARLYISIGNPVYLHINPGITPTNPPGVREPSISNITDPNYTTVFDKFEWTDDDAGLHANTTCVDFFCLPLMFEMKNGLVSAGTNGFSCSRESVTNALSSNPLLQPLGFSYRFLSPKSDLTGAYFPTNYFDNYVDYCWDYYKSHTLTISGVVLAAYFTATGQVNGTDQLILFDADNSETHTVDKPSSLEVFSCNGVFQPDGTPNTAPYERDGFVKDEIASALNRTVMHTPFSSWGIVSNFYQQNGLSTNNYRYNIYSQILHQKAIDHKIYGYPWDDKYNQESYISSTNGTALIVTLNRLTSGTTISPLLMMLMGEQ